MALHAKKVKTSQITVFSPINRKLKISYIWTKISVFSTNKYMNPVRKVLDQRTLIILPTTLEIYIISISTTAIFSSILSVFWVQWNRYYQGSGGDNTCKSFQCFEAARYIVTIIKGMCDIYIFLLRDKKQLFNTLLGLCVYWGSIGPHSIYCLLTFFYRPSFLNVHYIQDMKPK